MMLKYIQHKIHRYRYKYAFYLYRKDKVKQARKHFEALARKGDMYCCSVLGVMYYHGTSVEKDFEESLYWHKKAANAGFFKSQSILSNMYALGLGTAVNLKQALYWALKSARQGEAYSQYDLSYLYTQESSEAKDLQLAYMWGYIAVKNGFPDVQGRLAILSKVLSPQQVEEARHMAKICHSSGYEECFTEKPHIPNAHNIINLTEYKKAKGL